MNMKSALNSKLVGTALAASLAAGIGMASMASAPALAQSASSPSNDVVLSIGAGQQVRLREPMSDLFVANDAIADVQVRSTTQLYVFGKSPGQTTVYATNRAGKVVYSANVRVGTNLGSIDEMLQLAMPEAQIRATPINGMVLLTGTVATPSDVEEANRLVETFAGAGTTVVNRLKTATPLQVMLKVRIAEVSRSVTKDFGVNLMTQDTTGGFLFGLGRGRPPGAFADPLAGTPATFTYPGTGTTIAGLGNLFGLDILGAIDLAENTGKAVTLAEPTLVALSGETASFLAGGEFPIATSSGLNGTEIQFKEYGVSLAFTPIVMDGGRISMRVRPEVSELSEDGAIRIGGTSIPGLTTRRTETTVELGSGQSFMIGGLLKNSNGNSVEKAPVLGDLPILGALFRSSKFRRNESELVIVVTPYLVKPVSANQIALPTDGFRIPNEAQRLLLDKRDDSRSGEKSPMPSAAPPRTVAPGMSQSGVAAAAPATQSASQAAKPGFSF